MQNSFNSQELALLREVVDKACADIGGCDESLRNYFAARVIVMAQREGCDFNLLRSALAAGRSKEPIHVK